MRLFLGQAPAAFVFTALANIALCLAIGGLADGSGGLKIGIVTGTILAALPVMARAALGWLNHPDNVIRFVGSQVGASILFVAGHFFDALCTLLAPLALALRMPVLLFRMICTIVAGALAAGASAIGVQLSTPLGLANLAALAAITANTIGIEFATPIALLGLGQLILVLLVDLSETQNSKTNPAK